VDNASFLPSQKLGSCALTTLRPIEAGGPFFVAPSDTPTCGGAVLGGVVPGLLELVPALTTGGTLLVGASGWSHHCAADARRRQRQRGRHRRGLHGRDDHADGTFAVERDLHGRKVGVHALANAEACQHPRIRDPELKHRAGRRHPGGDHATGPDRRHRAAWSYLHPTDADLGLSDCCDNSATHQGTEGKSPSARHINASRGTVLSK
jgi:hypothetical protein